MPYHVAVLNFEGPLDLLLQLIERAQLEPSAVSLAEVTEQYISHSQQRGALNPEEAARFAALAAKLLYIKSLTLLAQPTTEALEDVEELQHQLAAYSAHRHAATVLGQLLASQQVSWSRQVQPVTTLAPSNLTLARLQQALSDISQRHDPPVHSVASITVTLAEMSQRLSEHTGTGESTLQSFFATLTTRLEVVVSFSAALELTRRGRLQLHQNDQFSTIRLGHGTTH